jgi:hypothetical protein
MWSAEGSRTSNTLTGADGLYNGRSVSRQYQPPSRSRLKYGASARAAFGSPLNWAIPRFSVKGIGRRDCAAFSNAGLFAIRSGARGQTGRARGELKTVRPGAATRERFLEGEGEKAFWRRGRVERALLVPLKRWTPLMRDIGKRLYACGNWLIWVPSKTFTIKTM